VKADAIVANAQPELRRSSVLKTLDVAFAMLRGYCSILETLHCGY
jgi:hypothetical protein